MSICAPKSELSVRRWGCKSFSQRFLLFCIISLIKLSNAYHSSTSGHLALTSTKYLKSINGQLLLSSSINTFGRRELLQFPSQRKTFRQGAKDELGMEDEFFKRLGIENDYFKQLGYKTITKEKKENTFIGPNTETDQSMSGLIKYFVPGFVAIWAVGYGGVFFAEISGNGLGDSGGFIGAGLAVFLLLALVGAAGYEVFKPLPSETSL